MANEGFLTQVHLITISYIIRITQYAQESVCLQTVEAGHYTEEEEDCRFYVQQLSEKIWAFCTGTVGAWYF